MRQHAYFSTKDERNDKGLPQRAAETDTREKPGRRRNEKDRARRRWGIAWPREVSALLCDITVAR